MQNFFRGKRMILLAIPVAGAALFFALRMRSPETVKPKRGPVVVAVYALGTVTSENIFNFKAGMTAQIAQLFVREGDTVQRGQRLIALDSGAIVTAPFNGTVTRVAFQKGEIIMPGILALTLMDLDHKYISVSLDQESAVRVKANQPVQISFESDRSKVYQGRVEKLYPQAGQFLARIKADLPHDVLPDMTADLAIETEKKENRILVPSKAILDSQVIRVRDGRRQKLKVETGAADGEWIEITNDVITDTDELVLQRE